MSGENPSDDCRICGSGFSTTLISDLKTRLGETYSLKQCNACSFVRTDPMPSAEKLAQYYDQNYWQTGSESAGRLRNLLYEFRMSGIISDLKKRVPQKGCILDWGAGDGKLVQLLEEEGFVSYGIDVYSAEKNQDNLFSATIENAPFKNNFFDAITCFHVLEHIDKPVPAVHKAFALLKPGGILVLEVPNIASMGFRVFKKFWHSLDIPVHLNHFSPRVMQRMVGNLGGARVVQVDYLSHRHSPSSLVLSLVPTLSPPRVRTRHGGRYPPGLMFMYLWLQIISYPFTLIGALIRRGEIVRMYVRKKA